MINADFADVSTVMANKGLALMGSGICSGPDRAIKAATQAISSPLLEDITIDGATGIIINITGSSTLTTHETNEAVTLIMEAADEDAEIIFGTVIDDELGEQIKVTVIATGLGDKAHEIVGVTQQPAISVPQYVAPVVQVQEVREPMVEPEVSFEPAKEFEVQTPVYKEEIQEKQSLAQTIKEAASNYEQAKSFEPNYITKESEFNDSSKAQSIAEKLGFMNFDEDEFDTPTYIRKDKKENQPRV